jgi:hypothetical protein
VEVEHQQQAGIFDALAKCLHIFYVLADPFVVVV